MKFKILIIFLFMFSAFADDRDIYTQKIHNDYATLLLPQYSFTNGMVFQSNPSTGAIESSGTTTTELGYLSGASSNLQAQIDAIFTNVSGLVQDSITDGIVNKAPSQNAVFDALALKSPLDPIAGEFYYRSDYVGTQLGTRAQPFNTFAGVLAAAFASGANAVIKLLDKDLTENWVINNYNANLLIQAEGIVDNNSFKLNGSITISGTSTRIRIKNIQVQASSGPDIIFDGCDGRMYLDNVQAMGGGIEWRNSWKRWYEFTDSSATAFNIIGTPATSPLISTFRQRGAPAITLNAGATASLQLFDSAAIGAITHTSGNLIIDGGRGLTGNITSTVNSPNVFSIYNFSTLNAATQTFNTINKTGTATQCLSGVLRNELLDTINGAQLANCGLSARDTKYLPAVPGNWGTVPTTSKEALDYLVTTVAMEDFATVTSSAYTIVDPVVDVTVNFAGTSTITLPSAIGRKNKNITIKNLTANNINVATVSAQTIDTQASPGILTGIYNSVTLVSDNANWFIK